MDVMINNLTTNQKMKIKCKRYIKKIAVFKDNLAVLSNDRICVYRLTDEKTSKIPKVIIKWDGECNLILVTTHHLIICMDNRVLLHTQANVSILEREWSFESSIKYIKVFKNLNFIGNWRSSKKRSTCSWSKEWRNIPNIH